MSEPQREQVRILLHEAEDAHRLVLEYAEARVDVDDIADIIRDWDLDEDEGVSNFVSICHGSEGCAGEIVDKITTADAANLAKVEDLVNAIGGIYDKAKRRAAGAAGIAHAK